MLNKFKNVVKYIAKKIKQGVKIMAEISKDIITGVSEVGKEVVSGTRDVINTVSTTAVNRYADHADKKLDMIKAAAIGLKNTGSEIYNDIKHINGLKIGVMLLFIGGGCVTNYLISEHENDKEVK